MVLGVPIRYLVRCRYYSAGELNQTGEGSRKRARERFKARAMASVVAPFSRYGFMSVFLLSSFLSMLFYSNGQTVIEVFMVIN